MSSVLEYGQFYDCFDRSDTRSISIFFLLMS